jgi:hypothetical protein
VDNLSVTSLRVKKFKKKLWYGIITLCLVISKKGADLIIMVLASNHAE